MGNVTRWRLHGYRVLSVIVIALMVGGSFLPMGTRAQPAPPPQLIAAVQQASAQATATNDPASITVSVISIAGAWVFGAAGIPAQSGDGSPIGLTFLAFQDDGGWQVALQYTEMFADFLALAPPDLLSPEIRASLSPFHAAGDGSAQLSLPWSTGKTWYLTGGPHSNNGDGSLPRSSLDFGGGNGGIRAARAGIAYTPCDNFVLVDHGDGWQTGYYHVTNRQVTNGQPVNRGDYLGEISAETGCRGSATGPHVHFSLRRNGVFQAIDGRDIGGWTVQQGATEYSGCLVKNGVSKCFGGANDIYNDGAAGSGGGGGGCTNPPNLISPGNGQTVGRGVTFTWRAPDGCAPDGYTFRISSGGDPYHPLSDPNADHAVGPGSPSASYTFSQDGTFYWHVAACKPCTPYQPGPFATWRIVVSSTPPPPPPSCNPTADQVALYVDPNQSGQCVVKGIGNYPNPSAIGLPNDSVSSIRVGANVKAVLCRNDNYDSCDWFDHDVGNLSSYNAWNDQVSSLRVESRIPQPPGKAHDPSPASGSTLSYRGSLDLSWQGDGDQFQIHVWSSDYQLDWWIPWQSARTLHLDNLAAGTYFWQVNAKNAGGLSDWTSPAWSFTIQPPQVSCANAYTTEYFNNESVSGAPAYIDCTPWPIDKTWQYGSPAPGVKSDSFSVRWTADVNFVGRVYRFYARGDDGIRVYVDNSLIIDQWQGNQPERTYDVNVSTGVHHLVVEYREHEGSALARFGWNAPVSDTTPPTASWVMPADGQTIGSGLLSLRANASDSGSGVERVEFSAKWDGVWHRLGTQRIGNPYTLNWDLCAAGVPDGDIELGLQAYDVAGNEFVYSQTRTNYHITKAFNCNPTNQLPVANAGPDQTVTDDDGDGLVTVRLDGSGSSDPDGTITAYSWSENERVIATGAKPSVVLGLGTHTLQLIVTDSSQATSRDSVTITVQPQPVDPDDNRTLTAGSPLTGTVAPATDQDNYWFDAVAGQVATLAATKTTGSQLDGYLTLYDPNGAQLATDDDSGGNQNPLINRLTLTVTGKYRVVVTSYARASSGGYSLQLTLTSTAPATCATIPANAYCAEYFSNETLSGGALVAITEDAPLNHEWWTSAPGNGIGEDHFSVRWRGKFTFAGGFYLFSGMTDDGVRVFIDGEAIGEDWAQHRSLYEFPTLVTAGEHLVTVEYYEQDGAAAISLDWRLDQPPVAQAGTDQVITDDGDGIAAVDLDGRGSYDPDGTLASYVWSLNGATIATGAAATAILPVGTHSVTLTVTDNRGQTASDGTTITINAPAPTCDAIGIPKNAYCAEYFAGEDLSGNAVAAVQETAPLDHDWGLGSPGHGLGADHFSARWQGRFDFTTGTYAFSLRTDDGIRIW
ncbi:MAG TPA: PA14 domain-containing protein, partial [Thermomicrobiales bacterium]|nr:PA14 domain-containing protein [Thermomicrobiales bacterium]